ncbi:plasmid partitioning protein RepA [Leisingera sp. M658]|uniref:plasmid partitioning protein RepA n=1 Tax=Leisingera sp. M658 TaxID=2867015 RepID=UPI0021A3F80B|nr:plasmid partitioning protein RepA [Leisingera sp. M658]UWQ77383.1 plasmid partitioning protein RepA [Leisingera sp. M658]
MEMMTPIRADDPAKLTGLMANKLKTAVKTHLKQAFAPDQKKVMRLIPIAEAAELLGVSMPYLRKCHADGTLPEPTNSSKQQRRYTAAELWQFRQLLAEKSRTPAKHLPWRREGEALQVWQFMNFKGGCSKTTATVHAAHYLALHGFRVLLIDMDPQGSLTGMCGIDPHAEFGGLTIYNAITNMSDSKTPMREVIKDTFLPGLSIAPADLMLSEFKMESRTDPLFATRLHTAIGQVQDDFDVVLIDSPPELDILTLTGMAASTSLLVPMTPSMMDLASTALFLELASTYMGNLAERGINLEYDHMRFLVTRDEPNDSPSQQLVGFLRAIFTDRVMSATSYKSTAVADATILKQSIYELSRGDVNRDTYDRARSSMDAVGAEIRQMIDASWGRI